LDSPPPSVIGFVLAAVPAVLAASFAAATATMGALSHARKTALRDSLGGRAGSALDRYLKNDSAIESRWLVLRVLGVAISCWYLGHLLPSRLGGWRPLLGALGAVIVYGIPAEALRAVSVRTADRAAPLFLQLLRPVELLAAPIAAPMVLVGRIVARAVASVRQPDDGVTETEVELIVNEGELNGSLDSEQSEMIRNVLDFGDLSAGEVMVPRTRVTAFDVATTPREVLQTIVESGHSRYPVYRERIDNAVGILHVKDLMQHIAHGGVDAVKIDDVMRKPVVFVPETQPASGVLRDMRVGRHHMAVVIDEFGGMAGVVTLEDLVEEIVGDIRDEHDVDEPQIVDLGEGRWLVDAGIAIAELSHQVGAELPEGKDYNSLGGFIVGQLGRVPRVGVKLTAMGLELTVREADERHVVKVEIARVPPSGSPSVTPKSTRVTAA
jgi:CBS domain containing-hemolysin-like protein